jgi:hypothetical protein
MGGPRSAWTFACTGPPDEYDDDDDDIDGLLGPEAATVGIGIGREPTVVAFVACVRSVPSLLLPILPSPLLHFCRLGAAVVLLVMSEVIKVGAAPATVGWMLLWGMLRAWGSDVKRGGRRSV